MDKTETAAKPELTRRLFFSRTAMSKAPVEVGRGWQEKVGVWQVAIRCSPFAVRQTIRENRTESRTAGRKKIAQRFSAG